MKLQKKVMYVILAIMLVLAMSLIGCGGNGTTTPTLTLTPNEVEIRDNDLSAIVEVTGTVTGEITLDPADLAAVPTEIAVVLEGTSIRVTGTRPTTDVAPITGSQTIRVTRGGMEQSFTLDWHITTTWIQPPTFTVTFDSAGGSAVPSQEVVEGGLATSATSTRTGFVPTTAGLFRADDDWEFGGWRLEGANVNWDFAVDTVQSNITLVAQWTAPTAITTPGAGGVVNNAIDFISGTIVSGNFVNSNPGNYILALGANATSNVRIDLDGGRLTANILRENSRLTIIGLEEERIIQLTDASPGMLFLIQDSAELVLGNNITLMGPEQIFNTQSLVWVSQGSLVMLDGSLITDNWINPANNAPAIGSGAAVLVSSGASFTMKGGEITENGGPAFVNAANGLMASAGATVNLQGGSIHTNLTAQGQTLFLSTDVGIAAHATDNNATNFTLSGDATIDALLINSNVAARNVIRIGSGWTGTVGVELFGQTVRSTLINTWWQNQPLVVAASGHTLATADVNRISVDRLFHLNDAQTGFILTNNADQAHIQLENTGANIGRLVLPSGGSSGLIVPSSSRMGVDRLVIPSRANSRLNSITSIGGRNAYPVLGELAPINATPSDAVLQLRTLR